MKAETFLIESSVSCYIVIVCCNMFFKLKNILSAVVVVLICRVTESSNSSHLDSWNNTTLNTLCSMRKVFLDLG